MSRQSWLQSSMRGHTATTQAATKSGLFMPSMRLPAASSMSVFSSATLRGRRLKVNSATRKVLVPSLPLVLRLWNTISWVVVESQVIFSTGMEYAVIFLILST